MTALYPGSFDPVTLGHLDIIGRVRPLFDALIVAVLENPDKSPMFSVNERLAFLKDATEKLPGVRVETYKGLLAGYAAQTDAGVIIRGVRSAADFDIESQRAVVNRSINGMETLIIVSGPAFAAVSGAAVREISRVGFMDRIYKNVIQNMVTPMVAAALMKKSERQEN